MTTPIYPTGSKLYVTGEKRPYKVQAADDRFVIATKRHFDTVMYFVCDFKENLRGPDNAVFCGGYETPEDCAERLNELQDTKLGAAVSYRRCVPLSGVIDYEINKVVLPDGSEGKTPKQIIREGQTA